MAENCIYKSVTLADGESYILPPGAKLLYVSDATKIDSACAEIPETDTTCYGFITPMAGTDVNNSNIEFYANKIKLDGIEINLNTAYGITNGTSVESNGFESAQGFVDRLAANIWNQLPLITNGAIVLGLMVEYDDNDNNGGDVVRITISVPDIFTTVQLGLIDINNTTSGDTTFFVAGVKDDTCSALATRDNAAFKGNLDS